MPESSSSHDATGGPVESTPTVSAAAKPPTRHGRAIALAPRMTTSTAFLVIARACSSDFAANLLWTMQEVSEERIHQLRVTVRRCRAAIAVFGDAIERERRRPIANRLRDFQQELAQAREWDVFLQQDLFGHSAAGHTLREIARSRQAAGYARATQAVSDPAILALPRELDGWIAGEVCLAPTLPTFANSAPDPSEPVLAYAARRLRKLRRRILKLGAELETLDPVRLHELRIQVKKIHYAADFFSSLWEGEVTEDYIHALKGFQDALGRANDFAVARGLIAELAAEAGPDGDEAIRAMHARTVWREAPVLCRIAELSAEFAKARPFWKDAAEV